MVERYVRIAVLAWGLLNAPEASAQERPAVLDALIGCRAQTMPEQRLSCFDRAVASIEQAERQGDLIVVEQSQVVAARRQLFGLELPSMPALLSSDRRAPPLNAIETTLTRAMPVGNGMWVFTLDDGSVWRQVNMEATRFSQRPGQPVRVRRAAIGSYLMTIGGSRAVRVRRVNE